MKQVDVYFYNNKIYNIEDMTVLATSTGVDPIKLQAGLKVFQTKYNIRLAIIGLNQPLRDAIYCVFPMCFVIIRPLDVIKMINRNLQASVFAQDIQQEIAAGLELEDEGLTISQMELGCLGIYRNHTKEEATHYYRQWQGDVPLGMDCFDNVISTIDYYYEEIFNYFYFKNRFDTIIL